MMLTYILGIYNYGGHDVWFFVGTESCVRIFDVDEDGRDDFIFGSTTDTLLKDPEMHRDAMKVVCQQHG